MKWSKKGLIYVPDGKMAWAKRYAFPPTPYFINDSVLRLYVAFCDDNTVGRIGFVDVAAENPSNMLNVSKTPVLDIGAPGAFDENGVVPTCVIKVDNEIYLYYVGYQLGYKVRYFQFEGLAISQDGGNTFTRYSRVPIIDRSDKELLNRTSAFVMHEQGIFKMWYVGGSDWLEVKGKPLPVYNMRYLESKDGKKWGEEGKVCIDFKNKDEHAFGRPWVIKDGTMYKMFYSIRTKSKGYRLGYAESDDGVTWVRKDEDVGIDVSESGWDSEMVAYSSIVMYKNKVYMFYNGNNCGETGFGYAVLEKW
jgi:hypothetical protein